jgi:hypothetical protein
MVTASALVAVARLKTPGRTCAMNAMLTSLITSSGGLLPMPEQAVVGFCLFAFVIGMVVGSLGIQAERRKRWKIEHERAYLREHNVEMLAIINHLNDRIEQDIESGEWWKNGPTSYDRS